MWLDKVTISNCRVINHTEFTLGQYANVFYGGNAAGKSSILEALCVLSRGRSFRTPRIAELIARNSQELTVSARVMHGLAGMAYPIGIRKSTQASRIRINHADVQQQAELSTHLPLTLIHPGSVELITGSPALRRAFLDWIAFYRFTDFNLTWRSYQQVLKQRNACLRDPRQRYALDYLTKQLISLQVPLYRYRLQALTALLEALQITHSLLSTMGLLELQLHPGFPQAVDIFDSEAVAAFLREKQAAEFKQGISLYGAHRADLSISLDGIPAVRVASRGQLKLLAVSLLLAQSHAVSELVAKRGIIAIDDLAAELDEQNQQALYNVLRTTQQQLIITATRHESLLNGMQDVRVFQVKHGQACLVQ